MAHTVLITGANGFIGSHTTLLMESLGHTVIPVDAVPRSTDLSLLGIQTPGHIMDVTDATAFRRLCDKEKPTHIFHAAHPPRNEDPSVLNFCYHAMTNILEAAKALKTQRVVYSSSASIYGQLKKPDHSLVKEEDAVTIYPTYFYRAAKTVSEWMGDFYKEKHGVSFVALRYSSVYGPGLYRSIPLELKKGILGQPCRPFLTRPLDDLIYVDDVVDAIRRALFADKPLSRAYNIGLDKRLHQRRSSTGNSQGAAGSEIRNRPTSQRRRNRSTPDAKPAGYFPGKKGTRLGTEDRSRRGHSPACELA
jgi:nucleoside-diphosphate-sugar epimerase